ncbi:hypothetical protein Tco_0002361, partial [Tanacetum coccineum]
DAVVKVFQMALQVRDPKKVHFALLGMYKRTEQHKLADELLEKINKKFKHSCKVWLRRIQRVLKQNEDLVQNASRVPKKNRLVECADAMSKTTGLENSGIVDLQRQLMRGLIENVIAIVKGLAPEEFAARNNLVQARHRIQALPNGAA